MTTNRIEDRINPDTPTCPPWCTLEPHHDWDSIQDSGWLSRGHGFTIGDHVGIHGEEHEHSPGVVELSVTIFTEVEAAIASPTDARGLAAELQRAATWIEAQQAAGAGA